MSEQQLDPELTALEQSLGRLEPASHLDRDRVMFRAGQGTPRLRWLWPASTAATTAAAAVLAFLLWHQSMIPPAPEPAPRVIVVEKFVPVPAPEIPSGTDAVLSLPTPEAATRDYFRLRQEVLRWGTDVLHPAPGGAIPSQETLTPANAPRLPRNHSELPNLLNFIPMLSGGDS